MKSSIPPVPPAPPQPAAPIPCLDSQKIFQGTNVAEILHGGQRYLLRITRENKLILTK